MSAPISVPVEVIRNNKADEFIELETKHQELEERLWSLSNRQRELYSQLKSLVNPSNEFGHSLTFNYEYFKKRKAWREALLMQNLVAEVVSNEGDIQETNAKYIAVREKLRVIYRKCGLTDIVI